MATTSEPLSASQRALVRRLSAASPPAPGDEAGELNIVPYLDIITNILVFVLATISIVFVTSVEASGAPQNGQIRRRLDPGGLGLTVLIAKDGMALTTSLGHVAPGCDRAEPRSGPGITVPRSTSGAYDWAALQRCVRALKADHPGDVDVTVAANPDVPYADIAAAVATLKRDDAGELFPGVHFGVPR